MSITKKARFATAIIAIACVTYFFLRPSPKRAQPSPQLAAPPTVTPTPFARAPVLAPPVATPEPPPPAAPVQVKEPETAPVASASAPKTAKAKRPKREIKDPLSRKALVLVGANTGAESYWLYAINNKDLPAEERADLIEDLNEEGFSDPDNPSREDLPLIISRLALITRHAPFARDSSNAEAFAEAYKDLMNMYYRLSE